MSDDVNFKSDKWIPEIKTLCMDFLEKIKEYPGGRFLCFNKYRLFYFDVPDETKYFDVCLYTKLANEYFVIAFLESIFRG